MKVKQLIQKQNVLVLAIITYAFTLLLPPFTYGMYDPKHGRWLQRDPVGTTPVPPSPASKETLKIVSAGSSKLAKRINTVIRKTGDVFDPNLQYHDNANLYEYVKSQPTNLRDPSGYVWMGGSVPKHTPFKCCKGKQYNSETHCCECKKVVKKVNMWRCIRPLDSWIGPWIYWYPTGNHAYICCDGPNKNCFGKQAGKNKGDPVDPERKLGRPEDCTKLSVCPSVWKNKCVDPKCNDDFSKCPFGLEPPFGPGENCQEWCDHRE